VCYIRCVSEIGLREMRQNASDLVRRAQAGERVTITVAGRPAAVLGPVSPRTWRRWDDLVGVFDQSTDPDWADDRGLLNDAVADPWTER
jgi:prevent-host-death family protein